jgi:hypothetical protein
LREEKTQAWVKCRSASQLSRLHLGFMTRMLLLPRQQNGVGEFFFRQPFTVCWRSRAFTSPLASRSFWVGVMRLGAAERGAGAKSNTGGTVAVSQVEIQGFVSRYLRTPNTAGNLSCMCSLLASDTVDIESQSLNPRHSGPKYGIHIWIRPFSADIIAWFHLSNTGTAAVRSDSSATRF